MRRSWIIVACLFAAVYFLIARLFPQPPDNLRAWRLAAWIATGAAFAVHIGYEHFIARRRPTTIASHTAVAVALAAFGLALAGMAHSEATDAVRDKWLIALVAWPAITAAPAFLAALATGTMLARFVSSARVR